MVKTRKTNLELVIIHFDESILKLEE